jgi:hypothetical protein
MVPPFGRGCFIAHDIIHGQEKGLAAGLNTPNLLVILLANVYKTILKIVINVIK